MNWKEIAQLDAELRTSIDNASEALARHRYENTIGAGVSFREYARQCGVAEGRVRQYANGWAVRLSETHLTISDALVKASTSAERYDVVEAIAEARQVTPKAIQAHHTDEVRRIQATAKEQAEKHGTTVKEEAAKVAQMTVRHEQTDKATKAARSQKVDLRCMELERYLHSARRALENCRTVDVDLDEDHREMLRPAVEMVRKVLALVELQFLGAGDVDWDKELSQLNGEA